MLQNTLVALGRAIPTRARTAAMRLTPAVNAQHNTTQILPGRPRHFTTAHASRYPEKYQPAAALPETSELPENADADAEPTEEYEDFGDYTIILPPEPFIFGTDHLKPYREVPARITRPAYALTEDGEPPETRNSGKIKLGGSEERKLRDAARLAATVRNFAKEQVKVGVTTDAIDKAIHDFIIENGAYPSPLGYRGFPKSCCTSLNNIVAHGIPDGRPLENGDIVNIDVTVYKDGYHGDTSQTFFVGNVDEAGQDLVRVTNGALKSAITACGPGKPFSVIGKAIHEYLKKQPTEYCVSPQFTGHGINSVFHCAPWIHHTLNEEPEVVEPGHCFTIEPAIIQGSDRRVVIFPDGWTATTENCARSAQAEHMVLITEDGVDVLTNGENTSR